MNKYKYLIVSLIALTLCQLIKFVIESSKDKKLKWGRLFNGSGGMPSSHSTLCFSLLFMVWFNLGISSLEFAILLVISLIVAYDSMGVRMESGKQAKTINKIVGKLKKDNKDDKYKPLKECLGHQPLEVLAGVILAFIVSVIYNFVIL